jgi:hypothetical protein
MRATSMVIIDEWVNSLIESLTARLPLPTTSKERLFEKQLHCENNKMESLQSNDFAKGLSQQ